MSTAARFFLILCIAALAAHAADRPPNVIIIFTDDQGYADVGVFGAKGFTTPNLDRMAHEGRRFTDFHSAQPVCSASRTGLLTGCYPNRIGIHGALGPDSKIGISDGEMTLAQLRQAARLCHGDLRQMAPWRPPAISPHAAWLR